MTRIVLLFCAAALAAQDFSALEKTAGEELAAARIPGAAIGIVRGGAKMFTAAALVLPAGEGKLAMEGPAGKPIPGLAGPKDDAVMRGFHDDAALGAACAHGRASIFSYSNPGSWMAGHLAEVAAGDPARGQCGQLAG